MDGRRFLASAQRLLLGTDEADWRTAAGRACYAIMLEARAALLRWGFTIPRRDQLHAFVRQRFAYPALRELRGIGRVLEDLNRLRNQADYDITGPGPFADTKAARKAIKESGDALAALDAIESDPAVRAAAVAAIRAAFAP